MLLNGPVYHNYHGHWCSLAAFGLACLSLPRVIVKLNFLAESSQIMLSLVPTSQNSNLTRASVVCWERAGEGVCAGKRAEMLACG
jgi:hypothetical protein